MTPYWILNKQRAVAHISCENGVLILENAYIRKVIDCNQGAASALYDGDGVNAIADPLYEAKITVGGKQYHTGVKDCASWEVHIHDGNETEKTV